MFSGLTFLGHTVVSANYFSQFDTIDWMEVGAYGELLNMNSKFFSGSFVILGADFIKTSTGKEGVNAILPVGLVMVRAIREYYHRTGVKACIL